MAADLIIAPAPDLLPAALLAPTPKAARCVRHVMETDPAHAVRGPKYVVLTAEEARALLDAIPIDTLTRYHVSPPWKAMRPSCVLFDIRYRPRTLVGDDCRSTGCRMSFLVSCDNLR
jgi:hypothetical protein